MDASLPTFDAHQGADLMDGLTMHFGIAPCKVNEIRRLTEADSGSVNEPSGLA